MVALRTTIMMVCLVAVPLAAVVGTALPRFLASLLDGRGKATAAPALAVPDHRIAAADNEPDPPAAADESEIHLPSGAADGRHPTAHITAVRPVPDAPRTARGEPQAPETRSPMAAVRGVRPAAAPNAEETAPFWGARRGATDSSRPRYTTAQHDSRNAGHPAEPSTAPAVGQRPERVKQGLHQANLLKTGYSVGMSAKLQDADRPLVKVAPPTRERDKGPPPNDPFATSEQRLRELGATYYRLEPWGGHGEFYRCACDVRLGPRSRAARHFEAIEPTASQAVAAVIEQVERKVAGRR